jgi:hypothetical protein
MVPGNFKLTKDDPKFPIAVDKGKVSSIWFTCDNSYENPALGIVAAPQQSLRVAVIDASGKVMQSEDILVGRAPGGATIPAVGVKFKNAAQASQIHVTQGSKGPADQRIGFVLV